MPHQKGTKPESQNKKAKRPVQKQLLPNRTLGLDTSPSDEMGLLMRLLMMYLTLCAAFLGARGAERRSLVPEFRSNSLDVADSWGIVSIAESNGRLADFAQGNCEVLVVKGGRSLKEDRNPVAYYVSKECGKKADKKLNQKVNSPADIKTVETLDVEGAGGCGWTINGSPKKEITCNTVVRPKEGCPSARVVSPAYPLPPKYATQVPILRCRLFAEPPPFVPNSCQAEESNPAPETRMTDAEILVSRTKQNSPKK